MVHCLLQLEVNRWENGVGEKGGKRGREEREEGLAGSKQRCLSKDGLGGGDGRKKRRKERGGERR